MYSTVNSIFHFSYFVLDWLTSGLTVTGLARVCCIMSRGTLWCWIFGFFCDPNIIICSYNTIKTWIQGGNTKKPLGPTLHMVAAAQAGILTLIMTNPIWVVKTRLCLQYSDMDKTRLPESTRYLGMMDALSKIYYNEGIRGLYKVCIVILSCCQADSLYIMRLTTLHLW
jgi:hypothetical protein